MQWLGWFTGAWVCGSIWPDLYGVMLIGAWVTVYVVLLIGGCFGCAQPCTVAFEVKKTMDGLVLLWWCWRAHAGPIILGRSISANCFVESRRCWYCSTIWTGTCCMV